MRHCPEHWAAMRKAVHDRGMSHLVAGDNKDALARAMREIDAHQAGEQPAASDFDPLMAMNWSFTGKLMERLGMSVMVSRTEEDGMPENKDENGYNHYCPLCVVRRDFAAHNTPTGKCGKPECDIVIKPGEQSWELGWIEGCADAMYHTAVEKGLIRHHG